MPQQFFRPYSFDAAVNGVFISAVFGDGRASQTFRDYDFNGAKHTVRWLNERAAGYPIPMHLKHLYASDSKVRVIKAVRSEALRFQTFNRSVSRKNFKVPRKKR